MCFLCRFLAAIDVDGVLSVYDLVSNIAAHNEDVRTYVLQAPVLVCVAMHSYIRSQLYSPYSQIFVDSLFCLTNRYVHILTTGINVVQV